MKSVITRSMACGSSNSSHKKAIQYIVGRGRPLFCIYDPWTWLGLERLNKDAYVIKLCHELHLICMYFFTIHSFMFLSTLEKLQAKYLSASRYSVGASLLKTTQFTPFLVTSGSSVLAKEKRFGHCFSVADSDQLAADSSVKDFDSPEISLVNDQLASINPNENSQLETKVNTESGSQTLKSSNGSVDQKQESAASPNSQSTTKRSSLTARERVRAARVLNRYTEPRSSKPDIGRKVLDALKESDRGKKRSRLPEAPTNLFDDSKRGMPKQGLTFDFLGVLICFSLPFHLFLSVQ